MAGAQDGGRPSQEVGLDGWVGTGWDDKQVHNDNGPLGATGERGITCIGRLGMIPLFSLGPAFDDTAQYRTTDNERAPLHQTGVCGMFGIFV